MKTDTKFAVATHIMAVLAFVDKEVSATFIGEQISINPVVVRRTLSLLNKAGLVISKHGPNGGSKLRAHPSKVLLIDIYNAIHKVRPFDRIQGFPKSTCDEGRRIDKVLFQVYSQTNDAMESVLAKTSLKAVIDRSLKNK